MVVDVLLLIVERGTPAHVAGSGDVAYGNPRNRAIEPIERLRLTGDEHFCGVGVFRRCFGRHGILLFVLGRVIRIYTPSQKKVKQLSTLGFFDARVYGGYRRLLMHSYHVVRERQKSPGYPGVFKIAERRFSVRSIWH